MKKNVPPKKNIYMKKKQLNLHLYKKKTIEFTNLLYFYYKYDLKILFPFHLNFE